MKKAVGIWTACILAAAVIAACGGGNASDGSSGSGGGGGSTSIGSGSNGNGNGNETGTTVPTPSALFQVGAAVVSIDPQGPLYAGGTSGPTKPAINFSHDPLQVRAFVVANGGKAVAFAVVDSTGWFAEYQGALAGYGQVGARSDAAQALVTHGFAVDRSAVMVSTTHSHATPTMVGIWGLMGSGNTAYVKAVHDAVVKAVDQAASNLKTSELWVANGDIRTIVEQNIQGTDHVDGFKVDSSMPILWARDPKTGATNAMYVNIPNHPDQVSPFFADGSIQGFSADVPGYVRAQMDQTIGGVNVVGSGTLGRQETPGSSSLYSEAVYQGDYVLNALRLAMASAKPLTSDALASTESAATVTVGSTADNQGLLTLMKYNNAADPNNPFKGPSCDPQLGGVCTVPRSVTAPWCVGNCTLAGSGKTTLGTYTTALRIGPLLYISNPGESFAEVNDTVRSEVLDAQSVNVVGLAGDFLGYNWTPGDYTAAQFGSSDFDRYNVGPDLAQATADTAYANAAALGFKVAPAKITVKAVSDSSVASLPGIQFYPTKIATSLGNISFYGSTGQPIDTYQQSKHPLSPISWDFGDGSAQFTSNNGDRFDHAFTQPGTYKVTATVTDTSTGSNRSWSQSVTIEPALSVHIVAAVGADGASKLSLESTGGQGQLLAAHWTCPSGDTPSGLTVNCGAAAIGASISVTAYDGAGNLATAAFKL